MAQQLSDNRGSMSTKTSTSKDLDATNLTLGGKKGKGVEQPTKKVSQANAISEELKKQYAK